MEMEMSDARDCPSEVSADDDMWACTKIAKVVPGFRWDRKCTWWIEGVLAEKACQWKEEDQQAHEKECKKMGQCWVNVVTTSLLVCFSVAYLFVQLNAVALNKTCECVTVGIRK